MTRPATEQDAEQVAGLWTEAFSAQDSQRTRRYTPSAFLELAKQAEIFVTDNDYGNGIAGTIALFAPETIGRVFRNPGEAELSHLAVATSSRRTGIGRSLVAFCERRARSAGWEAIVLWSSGMRLEAHRFYEALGYELIHRELRGPSDTNCVVFRRTL